jgi:hypothetical protein
MFERNEDEEPLAEVASTPEQVGALWKMHMEQDAAPPGATYVPLRLSGSAKAILDILMPEVETDDVRYLSIAMREAANWLDLWIEDGPGGFLLPN